MVRSTRRGDRTWANQPVVERRGWEREEWVSWGRGKAGPPSHSARVSDPELSVLGRCSPGPERKRSLPVHEGRRFGPWPVVPRLHRLLCRARRVIRWKTAALTPRPMGGLERHLRVPVSVLIHSTNIYPWGWQAASGVAVSPTEGRGLHVIICPSLQVANLIVLHGVEEAATFQVGKPRL